MFYTCQDTHPHPYSLLRLSSPSPAGTRSGIPPPCPRSPRPPRTVRPAAHTRQCEGELEGRPARSRAAGGPCCQGRGTPRSPPRSPPRPHSSQPPSSGSSSNPAGTTGMALCRRTGLPGHSWRITYQVSQTRFQTSLSKSHEHGLSF